MISQGDAIRYAGKIFVFAGNDAIQYGGVTYRPPDYIRRVLVILNDVSKIKWIAQQDPLFALACTDGELLPKGTAISIKVNNISDET